MFEFVSKHYGVTPQVGQRCLVDGDLGTVVADRGHYIGVNFDKSKPGIVSLCHPTWRFELLDEFVTPRKMTRSQQRYRDWLDADSGLTFGEWLRRGKT